jgi:hypothetical protein
MRITTAGIRIRISGAGSARIQGVGCGEDTDSWLDTLALLKRQNTQRRGEEVSRETENLLSQIK